MGGPPKVPTVAVPDPGNTGIGAGTDVGGAPFPEVPEVAVPDPGATVVTGAVVAVVDTGVEEPAPPPWLAGGAGTEIPTWERSWETVDWTGVGSEPVAAAAADPAPRMAVATAVPILKLMILPSMGFSLTWLAGTGAGAPVP